MSEFLTKTNPNKDTWNQKFNTVKATDPDHTVAGHLWYDTTADALKVRNAAASAYVLLNKTAETPSVQAGGDAANAGASAENARADHKHGLPNGSFGKPKVYEASRWEVLNGATVASVGQTTSIRMDAVDEACKGTFAVPPGATGVSAATIYFASFAGTAIGTLYVQALNDGENVNTGDDDNVGFSSAGGLNVMRTFNVIGAFNGITWTGQDALTMLVKTTTGNGLQFISLEVLWS